MIEVHCLIKKGKKYYSALCLEFDVASQGKTLEEAQKNIKEAVKLFVEDVTKAGEQEKFFKRRAPYKYWKEFYRNYYKQAPQQILRQAKFHHHPKIVLESVCA